MSAPAVGDRVSFQGFGAPQTGVVEHVTRSRARVAYSSHDAQERSSRYGTPLLVMRRWYPLTAFTALYGDVPEVVIFDRVQP